MPSDDRDSKFERALAQHLRGGSAQANCPDAETLAAYHERNLSLEEMARWKQHISACEFCQEALALVEATENQLAENWEERGIPVLEAASMPHAPAVNAAKRSPKASASSDPQVAATPVAINRRRPALLRWAIPLGAAAAGVLVFIGIYEQRRPKVAHYSDTVVAHRQSPATPGPPLDQSVSQLRSTPKDLQQESDEISRGKRDPELLVEPTPKLAERTKTTGDAARESRNQLGVSSAEKKKAAPPSSAPNIPVQASTDAAVSENAPVVPAAPRPAPPPAPLALSGSTGGVAAQRPPARADAKSVPPSATETITVESQAAPPEVQNNAMMMKQGVANGLVQVARSGAGLILTPDNKVFWKLQPAGAVQLTTDGGKKWKLLDTGANVDLTAGFAPSSRVCWIAGKAGTLLLTADRGAHWTRISTPIASDLGGVHAADAKHASIWDAAHQVSYETSDGGATWKQTSGK
jgi:hypothetical protein